MRAGRLLVALLGLLAPSLAPWAAAQLVVPSGPPFTITTSPNSLANGRNNVGTDGTSFLVAWLDASANVMATRVSTEGTVLDTVSAPLGTTCDTYTTPAVAFDGTNYLVVWVGNATGGREVFGVRITPALQVLDAPARQLTTGGDPKARPIPLAFGGGTFLTVWRTGSDNLRAARISAAGENVDDPTGFAIGGAGGRFYPWVAYGGGVFLVVYHGWGVAGLDVFGTRVAPDGTVLDPQELTIVSTPHDDQGATVASDGTNFLVLWNDTLVYTDVSGTEYGARVSAAGTVLDTPFKIAERVHSQAPAVPVYDGTNYFVIWFTDQEGIDFRLTDVYGRRVSTSGVVLDEQAVPIVTSFSHQWAPTIGYTNGRYLAVWKDHSQIRSGTWPDTCVVAQLLKKETGTTPVPMTPVPESGDSWALESAGGGSDLYNLYGLDDGTAFAIGASPNGYDVPWLRYSADSWSQWATIPAWGVARGLWASTPSNAWAIGINASIANYDGAVRFETGGGGWPPTERPMGYAIWGDSADSMFAVAANGRAWGFAPQALWNLALETGTNFDLWDVWGTSPTNVYAVGERGTIVRFDGTTWSGMAGVPTYQSLNGVWGASASDVYVVGDFGTILHYDGSAWTRQNSGTLEHLHGIWGLGPTEIYAVGFAGTILRFDGATWLRDTSPTTADLFDVWGSAATGTVWAVGRGGAMVKKTGAGSGCAFSATSPAVFPQEGGSAQLGVTTTCSWTAFPEVPWIRVTSSASGTGAATVGISVEPNHGASARTGAVRIGTASAQVQQAGSACTFTVGPLQFAYNNNQHAAVVNVATQAGCAWAVSASWSEWASVSTRSTTVGSGTVTVWVGMNPWAPQRSFSLQVAGQTVTIDQAGSPAPPCAFDVGPIARNLPATAGSDTIAVQDTTGSCAWKAETATPWITLTGPVSGSGPGGTTYEVTENPGSTPRSGSITIANDVITVTQAGRVTIAAVTPAHALVTGGSEVTIDGANFLPGTAVDIGGQPASIVSSTDTRIVVTAPAHAAGLVDVVVTTPDSLQATRAGFRYAVKPSAGRPSGDRDGDAVADIAVYRPSTGSWFWLESAAGNATYTYRGWGMQPQGDAPVRGDFDGDGVLDPTVYRPGTGTWFVLRSSSNYTEWNWFGLGVATDVPVPGDYDGDGTTDGAVYRPSTGRWYVRPSSGSPPWDAVFGAPGDVPVPGDYDGDGRTDLAVYRAQYGTWFILKSSSAFTEWYYRGWGMQAHSDVPVPGDYDGDDKTDVAVYRPATGTWFILKSSSGDADWTWTGWGLSSDEPAPADYDGDGKTDVAVYRPATGQWYVKPAAGSSPWTVTFGQAGDTPLLAF